MTLREREGDLERLDASLATVCRGTGQVMVLRGSPGVGKTRLLDELCRRADGRATVLRARAGEQERQLSLGIVPELFGRIRDRDDVFAGAAGLARPLLDHVGGAPAATFAVVHSLYWLTANLAETAPLLLALDDAHWTDETSQRWLAHLIPRVGELPVLLAVAIRPRELDSSSHLATALAAAPDAVVVEPQPFSPAASAAAVADVCGPAEAEFATAVHRATGGNPLLVRAVAVAIADAGLAPTAEHVDRLEAVGAGSISRIAIPRLHRLGADAVALARAVAILGDGRPLGHAGALAGLDDRRAATALDALVSAEIMLRDLPVGFTHPLVRAAVLEDVPPGATSLLHSQAASLLQARNSSPEDVGRHLLATEPIYETWAVDTLCGAAALAGSRGAPSAAITYLEGALRCEPPRPMRAAILRLLGWAAFGCRDPRGRGWLEEALELAEDPMEWTASWLAVATWISTRGEQHLPELGLGGMPELDDELRCAVAGMIALDYGFNGVPRRIELTLAPSPSSEPAGDTPFQRMWLTAAAVDAVMSNRGRDVTLDYADRAYADGALVTETPDLPHIAFVAWAYLCAGELPRAIEVVSASAADALRRGSLATYEWTGLLTVISHLRAGQIAQAETDLATWLLTEPEHMMDAIRPGTGMAVADVLRERGRIAEAEVELRRRSMFTVPVPPTLFGALLLEARGRLHLAAARPDAALRDFVECGGVLADLDSRSSALFTWRAHAAECEAALGRRDPARRYAEEQLADARGYGAAPQIGIALRALGIVEGGAVGIALLHEAIEVLAPSPARLEHARALYTLGVLLRRDRQAVAAREPLRQALDLAQRCGGDALADAATQELLAAGARPRRTALTGARALTPAELRIATLAADGLSNPQIAQSLFVTRKTVEKHLGNVFVKLGLTARQEIADALAG